MSISSIIQIAQFAFEMTVKVAKGLNIELNYRRRYPRLRPPRR